MKLGLKDLFKDVTWMQVGGGALAAATSLFLASSIGIAGSVIGAAVGSIVTTLSSALYKGFLTASNDAIKEKIVGHEADKTTVMPTAEKTQAMGSTPPESATLPMPDRVHVHATSHAPGEAERVRELARQRKRQRVNRIAAVVSLVTGIIAVGACAAVVYLATDGAGLGYRPEPQVRIAPPPPPAADPSVIGETTTSGADAMGSANVGNAGGEDAGDADGAGTPGNEGDADGADNSGNAGNPSSPTPDTPTEPPTDTAAGTVPPDETIPDEGPAEEPTPPVDGDTGGTPSGGNGGNAGAENGGSPTAEGDVPSSSDGSAA